MGRKEITRQLSELTEKLIDPHHDPRVYWAKEVTFDYGSLNQTRVDYMKFVPVNNSASGIEKGDFYCYEIKSSVADYHSKNGHNYVGDYNYYVMPEDVFEVVSHLVPYRQGVYVLKDGELKLVKKAKLKNRDRSCAQMLLMMFRSWKRDAAKDKLIDTVENDAYLLSCKCGKCGAYLERGYDEEEQYCPSCGAHIRMPAFSKEEVDRARFENEMDEYEDL